MRATVTIAPAIARGTVTTGSIVTITGGPAGASILAIGPVGTMVAPAIIGSIARVTGFISSFHFYPFSLVFCISTEVL